MDIFNDNLLSRINHLSTKFGPVMALFDEFLEHLIPKATAHACGGVYCATICGACCRNCGGDYESITYVQYTEYDNCNGASCMINIGCTYC